MKSYWGIVNNVIERADILLLVLDARQPYDTMNRELIEKARRGKKPLIYVISKADLMDRSSEEIVHSKLKPAVFVSAKTKEGINELYQEIERQAEAVGKKGKLVRVGVLGFPNVGKSSLINAMKGKEVARTSGLSGYTKFAQKIRAGNKILIIDTPGVLPIDKKDFMKAAMIGSLDFTHVMHPEEVVMAIMKKYPGKLEEFYGVEKGDDPEDSIDMIAIKKKTFVRGGLPDRIRMSRMILADWHKGIISVQKKS